MLYSHIRFMIADVEMPVSGPIYVSGGMLQTRLSFILSGDDKSLYYASPLARVKYERVPVKLLGSKPQASVADDENGGIGNYIVIFEGAADMQISFSQSTRQLDIAVQAVPLSKKGKNVLKVYLSYWICCDFSMTKFCHFCHRFFATS